MIAQRALQEDTQYSADRRECYLGATQSWNPNEAKEAFNNNFHRQESTQLS